MLAYFFGQSLAGPTAENENSCFGHRITHPWFQGEDHEDEYGAQQVTDERHPA